MFSKTRHIKNQISIVLSSFYALLLVLSSVLHQHHDSGIDNLELASYTKDHTHAVKTQISKTLDDCLICHFFSTGHSILPEKTVFNTLEVVAYHKISDAYTLEHLVSEKIYFSLRAPPAIA